MARTQYAIHGKAKGKKAFDTAPIAHVWAEDEADAKRQGELITHMNPIHNEHFSDEVEARG